MCDTCGCNLTDANRHLIEAGGPLASSADGRAAITLLTGLLTENDTQAAHNRAHFDAHGILVVNLMSAPGSGKTALLEATLGALAGELRIAVIEGDLETENDAERIRAQGVPAIQIVTGSACHLDAHMIHAAVHRLDLHNLDLVFIENVGNLVCPASFDLGHHRNVTLLSVTEGDDKPAKYPVMFRGTDLMIISKADLLEVLEDFRPQAAQRHLRNLANSAPVIELSARSGNGMQAWLDWLRAEVTAQRARVQRHESLQPAVQRDGAQRHAQSAAAPRQHAFVRTPGR